MSDATGGAGGANRAAGANGGRRPELEGAYLATLYGVDVPGGGHFNLQVGKPCPELAALYVRHGLPQRGLARAAYLTACNPASVPQPLRSNDAANVALRRQIEATGHPSYAGYAVDPEQKWPAEASFLVLGMAAAEAASLGRQFGQNAILVAGPDAVPELLWLPWPVCKPNDKGGSQC